ncbi:Tetratricopeptide repeat-containing protein [Limimonas halophila]|uniref:Tetratricopeptide repeat-containing protein n=1 Tax=Limimonas halophila TaxID=1082479 RepID=A0A1G7Q2V9_9PROT|nr:tetratricopeptide repeat-containing sulfotransferase family protein [Limimonas halophila]SDF92927.1 Tetratricopeptide repeat-containing protein [Limimonas halophila]
MAEQTSPVFRQDSRPPQQGAASADSPVFRANQQDAETQHQRLLGAALRAYNAGQLDRADQLLASARKRWPRDGDTMHLLGLVAWQRKQYDSAVAKIRSAIRANPAKLEYRTNLAAVYRSAGKPDKAGRELKRALELDPENAAAHVNMANLLRENGDVVNAASHYTKAIWIKPDNLRVWADFASMLIEDDRWQDGLEVLHQADAWEKDGLTVARTTAAFLFQRKRPHASVAVLEDAAERHGDEVQCLTNMVQALFATERYAEAFHAARRALRADRESVLANSAMAHALSALRRYRWAVRFMEYCVEQAPQAPQYRVQLANLVGWVDSDTERQKALCREALEINPNFGPAYGQLSSIAQIEGDFEAARDYIQKAMACMPKAPGPVMQFYNMQKDITEEDDIATVLARLESHENITIGELAIYNYTLGNLFDKVKAPERAIFYYKAANGLNQIQWKKKGAVYSREQTERVVAENREIFTADYIREMQAAYGNPSERPVFILGMPRSGTTLVEQILSSHPDVCGAGELAKMTQLVSAATQRHTPRGAQEQRNYPLWVPEAKADEFAAMARQYLEYLDEFDAEKPRVTDKMPHNFTLVGLIAILFPNARIIHCMRDPVDVCLSCFRQNFAAPHPYSLELSDLGHHYRQYRAYMAHWRQVVPSEQLYEVQYEELVQDQERVSRELVDHIGLDWDDNCLQFHQKERAVKTASLAQVRQPIYTKSMKKWKPYAPYLGELFRALGDCAPDDPEVADAIAKLEAREAEQAAQPQPEDAVAEQ